MMIFVALVFFSVLVLVVWLVKRGCGLGRFLPNPRLRACVSGFLCRLVVVPMFPFFVPWSRDLRRALDLLAPRGFISDETLECFSGPRLLLSYRGRMVQAPPGAYPLTLVGPMRPARGESPSARPVLCSAVAVVAAGLKVPHFWWRRKGMVAHPFGLGVHKLGCDLGFGIMLT